MTENCTMKCLSNQLYKIEKMLINLKACSIRLTICKQFLLERQIVCLRFNVHNNYIIVLADRVLLIVFVL